MENNATTIFVDTRRWLCINTTEYMDDGIRVEVLPASELQRAGFDLEESYDTMAAATIGILDMDIGEVIMVEKGAYIMRVA